MHEVSIALSLMELAGDRAGLAEDERVTVMHVDVGALAGVDVEALRFAFEVASQGTPLEGARLAIRALSSGTELRLVSMEVAR